MKCFFYGRDILLAPIAKLFNRILETGLFPTEWTKSTLTPIFKSSSSSSLFAIGQLTFVHIHIQ